MSKTKYVTTNSSMFLDSSASMPSPPEEGGPWEFVSSNVHTAAFRSHLGTFIPIEQFKPGVDSVQIVMVALWRSSGEDK